jgi:hypothetical protein
MPKKLDLLRKARKQRDRIRMKLHVGVNYPLPERANSASFRAHFSKKQRHVLRSH